MHFSFHNNVVSTMVNSFLSELETSLIQCLIFVSSEAFQCISLSSVSSHLRIIFFIYLNDLNLIEVNY